MAYMKDTRGRRLDRVAPVNGLGRDVWFIGDSITAEGQFNSATTITEGVTNFSDSSWPAHAVIRANGAWRYGGIAATSGFTPAQVLATHVPTVVAARPWACVVLAGTNYPGGGTVSGQITTLTTIYETLAAAGVRPILATIPPNGAAPVTDNSAQVRINGFIRRYGQLNGYPVLDFYNLLVDPTTGAIRSNYNLDNTHPNAFGKQAMGALAAPLISAAAGSNAVDLAATTIDNNLLIQGPLFTSLVGSNGAPNYWSQNVALGTSTITQETVTGIPGSVVRMTRGNTDINVASAATTTLVAGRRYMLAMQFGAVLQPDAVTAGTSRLNFRLETGTFKYLLQFSSWALDVPFGIQWWEFTAPPGLDNYAVRPRFEMKTAGTGYLRLGQFTFRDLTALGIA